MITYITDNVKNPLKNKRTINAWIKYVANKYNKKIGEIAYIFCNDEKILEVNKQYLEHDYYTDIITFDYCEGNTLSGDIFISIDTVQSNANEYNVSFEEELYRIIIHGILHLCGQEDKTPETRAEMTLKENDALEMLHLNIA
jgi:rRNA maturation RNase YbeY